MDRRFLHADPAPLQPGLGDVDLGTFLGHELGRRLIIGVGEVDLLATAGR